MKHWRTWPALKSNVDVVVAVYECATFASVRERRVDDAGDYASADEDDDDDVKICALRTVTKAPSKLMKKWTRRRRRRTRRRTFTHHYQPFGLQRTGWVAKATDR